MNKEEKEMNKKSEIKIDLLQKEKSVKSENEFSIEEIEIEEIDIEKDFLKNLEKKIRKSKIIEIEKEELFLKNIKKNNVIIKENKNEIDFLKNKIEILIKQFLDFKIKSNRKFNNLKNFSNSNNFIELKEENIHLKKKSNNIKNKNSDMKKEIEILKTKIFDKDKIIKKLSSEINLEKTFEDKILEGKKIVKKKIIEDINNKLKKNNKEILAENILNEEDKNKEKEEKSPLIKEKELKFISENNKEELSIKIKEKNILVEKNNFSDNNKDLIEKKSILKKDKEVLKNNNIILEDKNKILENEKEKNEKKKKKDKYFKSKSLYKALIKGEGEKFEGLIKIGKTLNKNQIIEILSEIYKQENDDALIIFDDNFENFFSQNENLDNFLEDLIIKNEANVLEFFLDKLDIKDNYESLLILAIEKEKLNSLKLLIDKEISEITEKKIIKFFKKALENINIKTIGYLLFQFEVPEKIYKNKKKYNLEKKNKKNLTPLQVAIKYGYFNVTIFLIELGANILIKSDNRGNLLHLASYYNKPEIIEYLINELNFEINKKDEKRGNTSLLKAVKLENKKSVEKLVELGADVNLINKDGIGALSLAICLENTEIIRILLNLENLDIDIENLKGETPLFFCSLIEDKEIFDIFLLKGADICKRDKKGNNILIFHLIKKNEISNNWKKYLIKCGVDPFLDNNYGLCFKEMYAKINQ